MTSYSLVGGDGLTYLSLEADCFNLHGGDNVFLRNVSTLLQDMFCVLFNDSVRKLY
jgi:hypothetical protein